MKPSSPRVRQLENRLQVLNKQLASEKRRLAGKIKDDKSLNDLLSGFQALTLEEEFAQKQLTSAMTSLEAARVRADAQTQYVEAFQRPVLADESLYPRPVLFTFIYNADIPAFAGAAFPHCGCCARARRFLIILRKP